MRTTPLPGAPASRQRRRLGAVALASAAALLSGVIAGPAARTAMAADTAGAAQPAGATEEPQEIIQRLAKQIIERIKSVPELHSGDPQKLSALVDEVLMPHVNFQRMTALAVGRWWRDATPEQRKQLMDEFRELLLRTYSGAVSSVNNQSVRMRPMRAPADATDVIVRSEIVQPGAEPVQVDYRMQKTPEGWKIYDVNVMGIWLVETYRNQFNEEASRSGVEGLIRSLADKNREFAPPAKRS
jgi:phospholipid transport system substrate-binding protein